MPEMNLLRAAETDMTTVVTNYKVPSVSPDSPTGQKETEYLNAKASQYLGYYKKIPELKKAIDHLATWVVGQGYTTDDVETEGILDHIIGWGEDTFNSILWNLFVQKKVYGDAFAEIIRDKETTILLNLKPLDPAKIKIVADDKGIIKRYEQIGSTSKNVVETFQPEEILHLCNDRVDDEIHGVSVIEAVEDVILAKKEAMDDYKTVLHRNVVPVRLIEVDTDTEAEITAIKEKYEKMIKNKEVLVVPKNSVKITTDALAAGAAMNPMPFLNYLDNFFYRAVGIPKIVTGGSEEFTEASSKIAYLVFEMTYTREQQELQADLWNQIQVKIEINKPVSLKNEMLTTESKQRNYGIGMQPSEMQVGRNE